MKVLSVSWLLVWASVLGMPAGFCEDKLVAKTKSGFEFKRVPEIDLIASGVKDIKRFGESWQDPSGLIWSDVIKKDDGSNLNLTQMAAEAFCESLGASLPTGWSEDFNGRHGFPKEDSDFVRLRKFMGAEPIRGYSPPKNYQPQVLPSLTLASEGNEIRYQMVWSRSLRPYRSDLVFLFCSTTGAVFDNTRFYYAFPFRCVVRGRE